MARAKEPAFNVKGMTRALAYVLLSTMIAGFLVTIAVITV